MPKHIPTHENHAVGEFKAIMDTVQAGSVTVKRDDGHVSLYLDGVPIAGWAVVDLPDLLELARDS